MPYAPLQKHLSQPEELIVVMLSYRLHFEIDFLQEIDEVSSKSCFQNPQHDITGIMIFAENDSKKVCFQYLEGPSGEIDQLLTNVSKDNLVARMKLEAMTTIKQRSFPQFTTQLVTIREFRHEKLKAIIKLNELRSLNSQWWG